LICGLLDGLPSTNGSLGFKLVDMFAENHTFANAVEIIRCCSALEVTNRETRGIKPRALISSFKEADNVCHLCRVKIHWFDFCHKYRESQKAMGPVNHTNDTGKGLP
jgi:hypothetical protein